MTDFGFVLKETERLSILDFDIEEKEEVEGRGGEQLSPYSAPAASAPRYTPFG
jgi:hypothetical protein